jgi:glycine/D-amino acid oxidase-like deaminating enzyme
MDRKSALADAEYVIIGGGAIGCGVAYSLAKAGATNVLVVERAADVGQATTSQGAGLCGQVRSTSERTRLAMHSVATFRELQRDPDVRPDWHEVGSLRVALSRDRAEEFRQLCAVADRAGLETELLDGPQAARRWPPLDFRAATAVLWCPSDGYMTPYAVAKAYEHQCRTMGVRFATDTRVESIDCRDDRVEAVRTSRGTVRCRTVVNAAGAHAYHVARLVGLTLPIVPVRHEYYVTVELPGFHPEVPCFRIPELTLYGRARDGGLLLGGWEPAAVSADPRHFPLAGDPPPVVPDWVLLNDFEARFAELCPQVRGAEKTRVGKGWPTFTPDGRFIIGESRRVKGFVMAGGCNAHGISGSAGIGRLLVEAVLDPKPSDYVKSLSPDRFTETPWTWDESRRQAARVYETYYGAGC